MINKRQAAPAPATFVKTATIIHLALVAGQVMFAALSFMITKNHPPNKSSDGFIYIVPVFAVSSFILSNVLFKARLGKIDSQSPLKAKLMAYQSALIIRMALLEGPSLFSIVCFLITGNLIFLGIAGVIIAYFIYLRPTKQKIEDDLSLGYEEKAELDGNGKAY